MASKWDTQGLRGKLVHEKNLKSKISCQTPFNKKTRKKVLYFFVVNPGLVTACCV
jgi:hypothetical protein